MQENNIPDQIRQVYDDIVSIKVQGATNVALATFHAIEEWARATDIKDWLMFKDRAYAYATMLANARPNEPLAKNGVKFMFTQLVMRHNDIHDVKSGMQVMIELAAEYTELLKESKRQIVVHGVSALNHPKVVFTHCHSSTAEAIITGVNQESKLTVIATETRPLYQGRITATNLLKAGVKTVMIVDGAAPYFIKDDTNLPVDAVLLGADEISIFGDTVNKVGSFSMGLSSYFASKPLYVVTPSLKLDLTTAYAPIKLEMRDGKEIWPEAPEGLEIINPAFDIVPHQFITGFITEFGVIKPVELEDKVRRAYEWVS